MHPSRAQAIVSMSIATVLILLRLGLLVVSGAPNDCIDQEVELASIHHLLSLVCTTLSRAFCLYTYCTSMRFKLRNSCRYPNTVHKIISYSAVICIVACADIELLLELFVYFRFAAKCISYAINCIVFDIKMTFRQPLRAL